MFSRLPFSFIFVFSIVFGTLFSISSSHWLGIWAGLEINLIGFLPILVYQKSILESESAVKYFVVQALGSSLLIFGSLSRCRISFSWDLSRTAVLSSVGLLITRIGLITKIGVFPFHFWLPSVIAGLPWLSCLLLATWQKIAPLLLVNSLFELGIIYNFIFLMCLVAGGSSLLGGIGGINQTQTRAILAYSSIGHLGWLIFALVQRTWAIKTYFSIYILISFCVFISLWYLNLNNIKNLNILSKINFFSSARVIMILLSLGGLPPLLGFVSKWVVIVRSTSMRFWIFLFPLILGSVMSLFYYLNLYFSLYLSALGKSFLNIKSSRNSMFIINRGLLINLLGGIGLALINILKEF